MPAYDARAIIQCTEANYMGIIFVYPSHTLIQCATSRSFRQCPRAEPPDLCCLGVNGKRIVKSKGIPRSKGYLDFPSSQLHTTRVVCNF